MDNFENAIQKSIIELVAKMIAQNEGCKDCPVMNDLQHLKLDAMQYVTKR